MVDGIVFCGGTLAGYAQAEVDITAVYAGEEDRQMALRVARVLGLRHLVFLGGPRGQLDRPSNAWLSDALVDVARAFEPQVVVTVGRTGTGDDPDHAAVAAAVAHAFVEPASDDAEWARPGRCYSALLTARQIRVLEPLAAVGLPLACLAPRAKPSTETGITTMRDVSGQRDAKVAAMRIVDEDASTTLATPGFAHEAFQRLRPSPWISGVLENGLFPGFDERRLAPADIARAS